MEKSNGEPLHNKTDLLITGDGSPTLFSHYFQATYHSKHGSVQESVHVFIQTGLHEFLLRYPGKSLRIFEMGFGTGLNAWLSLLNTSPELEIEYHAVEKFPVESMILDKVADAIFKATKSDGDRTDTQETMMLFKKLHEVPWGETVLISDHFKIHKYHSDLHELSLPPGSFDLVFYDAFGPLTQPDLWDESTMEAMNRILAAPGCLVTYCAQGAFRRALKSAGFVTEKVPGPPGKREMTRAWKEA